MKVKASLIVFLISIHFLQISPGPERSSLIWEEVESGAERLKKSRSGRKNEKRKLKRAKLRLEKRLAIEIEGEDNQQALIINKAIIEKQLSNDQKRIDQWVLKSAIYAFRQSILREEAADDFRFGIHGIIPVLDLLFLDKSKDYTSISKEIVEAKCNSRNHSSNTAHVQTLCNSEFDIYPPFKTPVRTSPLEWSIVNHRYSDTIKALLRYGADPDKLDEDNKTVLDHIVATPNLSDRRARIDLLLKYGARKASSDTIDQLQKIGINLPNQRNE